MSDGGDSGPSKERRSTTSSGPRTPVIRRITRSGASYRAESRGGVTHPSTQSAATGPRVAGGGSGSAGGVGEAVGPVSRSV